MKRRIALKICRIMYEFSIKNMDKRVKWRGKRSTIVKATKIGRKCWLDDRFPYIPSKSELDEQADIMVGLFAGLAVKFADEKNVPVLDEIRNIAFDFHHIALNLGEE